jgi:hypothetical protein
MFTLSSCYGLSTYLIISHPIFHFSSNFLSNNNSSNFKKSGNLFRFLWIGNTKVELTRGETYQTKNKIRQVIIQEKVGGEMKDGMRDDKIS